ncbi:MAG: DUF2938 domain-containing protein [Pseudomonadota bacterium]|nr:DUF2938 domain-containing protein [Pseudomonadota bacterium]
MDPITSTIIIGAGATATMDLWTLARKSLFDVPLPNYALVGRWIAHMRHGRFRHAAIAATAPSRYEALIGWVAHYLIGMAFASLLTASWGADWLHDPTIAPALVVGVGTVMAPFLLMQPGMGAGIAARLTRRPAIARLHSLTTHAVFGLGLYLFALLLK